MNVEIHLSGCGYGCGSGSFQALMHGKDREHGHYCGVKRLAFTVVVPSSGQAWYSSSEQRSETNSPANQSSGIHRKQATPITLHQLLGINIAVIGIGPAFE